MASKLTTSDEQLLVQARTGVQNAFAELWSRHYRSGICVARQYTSIDADDLVSESFARIYQRVLAGGGPQGAFRPYLYTTIRNLASTWGAASHEVQVDEIADFEDPTTLDDPVSTALDHTLTAQAFRELPQRWQSVLWYTEVEGMDPHEVAPILGISANSVAALAYRAREGLRKAWLQAHISDATASGECQWAMSKFGEHARKSLSRRDERRIEAHLESCTRCAIVCEEVDEVGSRLALVMIPLLLGGVAGGGFLSAFAQSGAAALTAAAAPAMPGTVVAGSHLVGVGAVAAASGASAGALPVAVAGSLAAVIALTGSLVVLGPQGSAPENITSASDSPGDQSSPNGVTSQADASVGRDQVDAANITIPTVPVAGAVGASGDSRAPGGTAVGPSNGPSSGASGSDSRNNPTSGTTSNPTGGTSAGPSNNSNSGSALGSTLDSTLGAVGGVVDDVGDVVGSVVGTITGGAPPEGHTAPGGLVSADVDLNLVGTATPGAHLSLQAAGLVYATTTVANDGTFVLNVTGVPGGLSSLDLVQTVDRSYLSGLVGSRGLLGGLFGAVDGLINNLIEPLNLSSGSNQGINITLLS